VTKSFQRIGVVGAGLIGMSWTSLFLAKGCEVVIVDPDPQASARIAGFLESAWGNLRELGLAQGDCPTAPVVTADFNALRDVDFVQENGPENLTAKHAIIAAIESVVDRHVVIASSTSSLRASDMQDGAMAPGRILVAHPMNPPHLVPMVELVGGQQTDPESLDVAEGFYQRMDRVTIRVKREVPGHLANRLTSALYREAVHLVAEGIADVADVDRAIAYGPGMRWALMGPHLIYHLGGGAAGYRGYLEHLGSTQEARWDTLGAPTLDEHTKAKLIDGIARELEELDAETLIERRDAALVALARLKASFDF
jgi:carnitine 3-dehydrogenase